MTAKEALQLSIDKYKWIAENPDKRLPKRLLSCSLCTYSFEQGDEAACTSCPMLHHWPTASGSTEACEDKESLWMFMGSYKRSTYALILVEAFEERLNSLENKSLAQLRDA